MDVAATAILGSLASDSCRNFLCAPSAERGPPTGRNLRAGVPAYQTGPPHKHAFLLSQQGSNDGYGPSAVETAPTVSLFTRPQFPVKITAPYKKSRWVDLPTAQPDRDDRLEGAFSTITRTH